MHVHVHIQEGEYGPGTTKTRTCSRVAAYGAHMNFRHALLRSADNDFAVQAKRNHGIDVAELRRRYAIHLSALKMMRIVHESVLLAVPAARDKRALRRSLGLFMKDLGTSCVRECAAPCPAPFVGTPAEETLLVTAMLAAIADLAKPNQDARAVRRATEKAMEPLAVIDALHDMVAMQAVVSHYERDMALYREACAESVGWDYSARLDVAFPTSPLQWQAFTQPRSDLD